MTTKCQNCGLKKSWPEFGQKSFVQNCQIKKVTKWIERCFGRNASFCSNNSRKKITKSKSFTQENEKNDPAKGKKNYHFATTTYYN